MPGGTVDLPERPMFGSHSSQPFAVALACLIIRCRVLALSGSTDTIVHVRGVYQSSSNTILSVFSLRYAFALWTTS